MRALHSRLPPSGAAIWGACPGSVKMTEGRVDTAGADAELGTAVHEIAAKMINGHVHGAPPLPGTYLGTTTSNGVLIGEEEFDAAMTYTDDVADTLRSLRTFGGPGFGLEQTLAIPLVHEECFGTSDFFIFRRDLGVIYIYEYKHGHGIVEVVDNAQLICYLAGIISLFKIDGAEDQRIRVTARIVQPRAYHRDGPIREWSFLLSDIRSHVNRLRAAAEEARSPRPRIISGPQCRYCAARFNCPSAREAGLMLYEATYTAAADMLTDASLGTLYATILRAQAQLACLETGIGEQVKARIRSGASVPGFTVEEAEGREAWASPAAEIIAMGDMLGVPINKSTLITPAQARKAGMPADLVDSFCKRPGRGFKVIPDNNLKARSIFNA